MKRLRAFLGQNLQHLVQAGRVAPAITALALLVALACSVAVTLDERDLWKLWARFTLGAGLALPGMLAAVMMSLTGRVNHHVRWTLSLASVAVAMLYIFVLTDLDLESHAWRTALLYGGAWSGLLLVAHASRRPSDNPRVWFWVVNRRLAERVVVVFSFAILLWIGLALALAAIAALFDVDFVGRAYAYLGSGLFFALVPTLIVGGLPEVMRPGAREGRQLGAAGRWIVAYVMTPLTVVYTAILYAYHVKLFFDGELPQNTMSPLAGGAAVLGLLSMLQLSAAAANELPPISSKWLRVFPAVFLPMLPAPIWAVWVRVSDYGWTQFRIIRLVFLLIVGLVCVVGVSRIFQKRATMQTWIVAPFAIASLLLAVGPWSANAVSIRDQKARVTSLLQAADMLTSSGVLITDTPFSNDGYLGGNEHPGSGIAWLRDNQGDAYVADWLGLDRETLDGQLEDLNLMRYWSRTFDENEPVHFSFHRERNVPLENVPGGTWHNVVVYRASEGQLDLTRIPVAAGEVADCFINLSAIIPEVVANVEQGDVYGSRIDPGASFAMLNATTSDGAPCGTAVLESVGLQTTRSDPAAIELQNVEVTLVR